MKKNIRLFLSLLAILTVPVLCQASTIILSNASPNHTITSSSDEQEITTIANENLPTLNSDGLLKVPSFIVGSFDWAGEWALELQMRTAH